MNNMFSPERKVIKMKKLFSFLLVCVFGTALLTGCGAGKLPDGMEKDALLAAGHAVIEALDAGEYDLVVEGMDDTMKAALPADKLAEAWEPVAEKVGAFTAYSDEAVTGKDGWGVAVIAAKYESGSVQFTLSFDSEMRLGGLYMK